MNKNWKLASLFVLFMITLILYAGGVVQAAEQSVKPMPVSQAIELDMGKYNLIIMYNSCVENFKVMQVVDEQNVYNLALSMDNQRWSKIQALNMLVDVSKVMGTYDMHKIFSLYEILAGSLNKYFQNNGIHVKVMVFQGDDEVIMCFEQPIGLPHNIVIVSARRSSCGLSFYIDLGAKILIYKIPKNNPNGEETMSDTMKLALMFALAGLIMIGLHTVSWAQEVHEVYKLPCLEVKARPVSQALELPMGDYQLVVMYDTSVQKLVVHDMMSDTKECVLGLALHNPDWGNASGFTLLVYLPAYCESVGLDKTYQLLCEQMLAFNKMAKQQGFNIHMVVFQGDDELIIGFEQPFGHIPNWVIVSARRSSCGLSFDKYTIYIDNKN